MNPNGNNPNESKLLYPELSFTIMGILFSVHNKLGGQFEEKYYQRAVEKALQAKTILYKRELQADLYFEDEKIGKYFLDFLIDGKIVLELKTVPRLLPVHFRQVRSYLKVNGLELGILANFRGEKISFQRILQRIN